ncbi:MAG TPA: hypothetical protein VMI94_19425 [Bryobacteraceae bacterium]|nr:hypothetical protein [Bryobacteraceae bacterium]
MRAKLLEFLPLAMLAACAWSQDSVTVAVPATANIFAAGQSSAFSGTLPPTVAFPAGSVASVQLQALGRVTLGGGEPYAGPAGIPFHGGTDLTTYNGLSGIIAHDRGFFLTGVFLDDSTPAGIGPPPIDFTGAENFLTLSPLLFQTFFIGNGGSGPAPPAPKTFFVPAGATRLFLGIADGCLLALGPPGCYEDNTGWFMAEVLLAPSPHAQAKTR